MHHTPDESRNFYLQTRAERQNPKSGNLPGQYSSRSVQRCNNDVIACLSTLSTQHSEFPELKEKTRPETYHVTKIDVLTRISATLARDSP